MDRRHFLSCLGAFGSATPPCGDIYSVAPDLEMPTMRSGPALPGRRVRQCVAEYAGTDVHHSVYLPVDWDPLKQEYPVLVEYAGNGNYHNSYGDRCDGTVSGATLGYGISGGHRFIWICLPFVDTNRGMNSITWWGDVQATVAYCKSAVEEVCQRFNGDRSRVFILGFSRGAIACNYIGLHDDSIAALWRGFVAHSHYDGVRSWPYPNSERTAAVRRLRRLEGRPSFLSQECSIEDTRSYLLSSGVEAPFELVALPYRNHTDRWVLRDIPARRQLRQWINRLC